MSMNEESKPLPKSILLVAGVLVVLIMSAFIPARYIGVKPVKYDTPIDFSKLKTTETFTKEVDTDSNGTLTWKELISTVAGDSIASANTGEPDPKIKEMIQDPNNLTSSFSKNFLVSSAYIKNNEIADAATQNLVLNGIIDEEKAKVVSKKYTYTDIKVSTKESKETIRIYGNEMAKIMNSLITKKNIEGDFPGVQLYLKNEDERTLAPIQADAKRVSGLVEKLLLINVPSSAVVYHLIVLNQIVTYRDTLANLSVVATDPVRTAMSVKKYPATVVETLLTYKKLAYYFTLKNIVFTAKEPGYVFTVGYTLQ